jgi:hypothetical protein
LLLTLSPVSAVNAASSDQVHWTVIGPTAVTFDWRGPDTHVLYGTRPGVYTSSALGDAPAPLPDGAGPFHEARLIGLLPHQRYYYRIGSGAEHTFETPPPRGSSGFWFAEQADVGSSLAYAQVAVTQDSLALSESSVPGDDRPAFVLVAGDLTYGDQNSIADVDQHFNDVMAWSQDAAYMPAWGNHDWDPAGSLKPDQANNYRGRFDLPNARRSPGSGAACVERDTQPGEDWYWFDYGNVRFIAEPPASEGTCGMLGARVAWRLAADSLMRSVDQDSQIRFVITFGHFPPYSSGVDHGGDAILAADLAQLRAAHPKYVLHIAAHSHHYERFNPLQTGGLLHVLGAGGGSTLGGLAAPLPESVKRLNHTEHLKIHVTADRIDGYCVCGPSRPEETEACTAGTIVDTWTITSTDLLAAPVERPALPVRAGWYDVQGRRVLPGAAGAYFRPGKPRLIVR